MGSKTYVASTVYNLAGDTSKDPSYKRTAVASSVVRGGDIALDIRNAYLGGPAITARSFGRWCVSSGFNNQIQLAPNTLESQAVFGTTDVAEAISAELNETVEVIKTSAGVADIAFWAERYVLENLMIGDVEDIQEIPEHSYEYDKVLNQLTIKVGEVPAIGEADTRTPITVAVDADFDYKANYVYALYRINTSGDPVNEQEGDWVEIDNIAYPPPTTIDWNFVSGVSDIATPVTIYTTVKKVRIAAYGNAEVVISEVNTPTTASYYRTDDVWFREVFVGNVDPDSTELVSEKQRLDRNYSYKIVSDVDEKITSMIDPNDGKTYPLSTKTTVQTLVPYQRFKRSIERVTFRRHGPFKLLIYKEGGGIPALDNIFTKVVFADSWLPHLPIWLENKSIEERAPWLYVWVARAYKKMFGRTNKLSSLIESLKDNPSIKDIDFAHIVFGVSLNTPTKYGKQYMFKFLEKLQVSIGNTAEASEEYFAALAEWKDYYNKVKLWEDTYGSGWGGDSQGPPPPYEVPKKLPALPKKRFVHESYNPALHFRQVYEYSFIKTASGIGRQVVDGKPAKIDSLWWVIEDGDKDVPLANYKDQTKKGGILQSSILRASGQTIKLYWQVSSREWKSISITDFVHTNFVYNGATVVTTGAMALVDEDESPFIIPTDMDVFKKLGIVDGSEMTVCTAYMVLNSYVIVKKKWYQSGIFQVILVIVVIVVSYFFPPAGGAAGGILGTNVAVGTAIVGAGTSAFVIYMVGAVANAIAGMILANILTKVATGILGNSFLGTIFATVAVIVMGNYQSASAAGGQSLSLSEAFGSLLKAENIMKLSMSAATGLQSYINDSTAGIMAQTEEMVAAYAAETKRIQEMYVEQFGGATVIDPMAFTQAGKGTVENVDTFLARTLMTGIDIAEMSHSMLSNFSSLTTTNQLSL